jgi:hypothetical protein
MKIAWLLGNGPSLKETPLHLLEGDTWAVNKIRLLFPHTDWRPKYYVRTDDIYENQDEGWYRDIDEVLEEGAYAFLGPYFYKYWAEGSHQGRVAGCVPICGEHVYHHDSPWAPTKWHANELCNFGGSLSVAIQIMNKENRKYGYDAIYLVGCDLGYSNDVVYHFDPNYNNGVPTPYAASVLKQDKIAAHEIAMKCSKIPIFNATIGGELEVYPRVNLESVLCPWEPRNSRQIAT